MFFPCFMHFVFGLVFGPWPFYGPFEFLLLFIFLTCNSDGHSSILAIIILPLRILCFLG
ncbi:hypothetical protein HanIR_Chr07g0330201 [Helianthus annuus]|nr:hypothetical protein HanIR_Chr07g0330201 [Helianthus annuus]